MLKAAAEMTDAVEQELPECLTRDNLTSDYFPNTSTGTFAAVAVLCAIFTFTSLNKLNHTDLWAHLSFGRWIVEHHNLPASDPFAAAPGETGVLPYAWLSQVLGYEVWRFGGNDGLILAHALLETLAAGIIMLAVARRGVTGYWPAVAGLAFVILSLPILGTIRPQLFSQVAMALVLLGCSELPRSRHPWFWLPLVFALWANLHATMVLGLGVLGIMLVGEAWLAWEASKKWSDIFTSTAVRHFAVAIGLCLLASCLNPHGPLMFIEALAFGRSGTVNTVSEWQRMSPTSFTGGLIITSTLLAFFVFREERKPRWHELALLLLVGLATFGAIRMLVWWAIIWPWVVIPVASRLFFQPEDAPTADSADTPPADDPGAPSSMRTVMAMALVFVTCIAAPPTHSILHSRTRGPARTMSNDTPYHVADEINRRELHGSFVAPNDWADYILWTSHDAMKPLVYGHFHLATPQDLEDNRQILGSTEILNAQWLTMLRKHNMQYVLASRTRNPRLVIAMYRQPEVRIIYQDKQAVLAEVLPPSKPQAAPAAAKSSPESTTEPTTTEGEAAATDAAQPTSAAD